MRYNECLQCDDFCHQYIKLNRNLTPKKIKNSMLNSFKLRMELRVREVLYHRFNLNVNKFNKNVNISGNKMILKRIQRLGREHRR